MWAISSANASHWRKTYSMMRFHWLKRAANGMQPFRASKKNRICMRLVLTVGFWGLGLWACATAVDGSFCLSRADCCSFSHALPCCGASVSPWGTDALRCGSDGICYRGTAPCQSSQDDPLCNLPNANSADDDENSWRTCRQGSPKMQALETDRMYGGSALHMAVLEGREGALDWMLHHEQRDLNTQGHGGATPLHSAVVRPAGTSILQFLLAHGARVNAVDAFGFTPLHRAIQSGNFDGATLLLSSGANLTLAAPGGETPLHLAAYENSQELAQLLLAFGADPFARNDRGATGFDVGLFEMSVPPHHMT